MEKEVDPRQYFENRTQAVEEMRKNGINPYPHSFKTTMSIETYIKTYSYLAQNETSQDQHAISGRIRSVRSSSRSLVFFDLYDGIVKLQILVSRKSYVGDMEVVFSVRRGDIVGLRGTPIRSKTNELSLLCESLEILAPCMHPIPVDYYGLKNTELRHRQRYLDLIINPQSFNVFRTRSKIIDMLRKFLVEKDFIEVETPILNLMAGGAAAKPFFTHHNELDMKLYLRIATELPLKTLVVGGMNRVFEIGKQFRNEGIDQTHNPEFTTMEFYAAYWDYYDAMEVVEELFCLYANTLCGSTKVPIIVDGKQDYASFERPFRRIDIMDELERVLDVKLDLNTVDEPEFKELLVAQCVKHKIEMGTVRTVSKLLDKLIGHFIEPQCISPTFLINHPRVMSPLAKSHRERPNLVERFELFVGGSELANSYTELNDPVDQRRRFQDQMKDVREGDDEAQLPDEDFCTTLEYGLPPTAGCGIGIDRLVMLFTNTQTIKDVILFPTSKPKE